MAGRGMGASSDLVGYLAFDTPVGERRALVGGDLGGYDNVFIWFHGGSGGPKASYEMVERVTSVPGRLDIFPQGLVAVDNNCHWIHSESWDNAAMNYGSPERFWVGYPGLGNQIDYNYIRQIAEGFNKVRVFGVGYSGGAGFLQAFHHDTTTLSPFAGIGLTKNTLIEKWITDGKFVGTLPLKLLYWFATGDPLAEQRSPHLTNVATQRIWRATRGVSPRPETLREFRRHDVTWEEHDNLVIAEEQGGSHSWVKFMDEWIAEWLVKP